MNLPNNPFVLLSYINTKLRDNYSSLDELINDLDLNKEEIKKCLKLKGEKQKELFATARKIREISQITYKTAALIGVFQLIAAIFPGTSRSGATIVGALLIGVSRTVAAEFTFFLAIPVMLGASLLKVLKFGLAFGRMEVEILLVGMVAAFVVSLIAIKFLMGYVKKHDFKVFGWYRIILGALVLVYFGLIA